jgi:cystathionine beta-lyase
MNPATRLITGGRRAQWTGIPGAPGAVVNPAVWRASTHLYPNVASLSAGQPDPDNPKFYYGRQGGPTQWALAEALNDLEPGAGGTVLFPSGVAAITTALLCVLEPGDTLLMADNVYDPSRSFADKYLAPRGINTRYFDPALGAGVAQLFDSSVKAIFLESPGSLTFEVCDVPTICAAARDAGIVSLLDNTWATSLFFPAIRHGADLAITAATKYIVGHSDVMMGSVTASAKTIDVLRATARLLGHVVSPDDAYLALRGLRTMAVRLQQHQHSALTIAQWLASREEVGTVYHPALPGSPGHTLWNRDFSGSSGLFSFTLKGGNSKKRAAFIEALSLFGIGYSWGGFESLALPVNPAKYRTATQWRADGPLIRLHIGLEDSEDLIADLAKGFVAAHNAG